MSIQDWGAIGELVSGIAIVVSLIYVGVQLRQGTQATRVGASQAFVTSHCAMTGPIYGYGSDFRDLYWRGLGGLANLQGSELAAFGAWMGSLMRMQESFYFQWKAHAFEDPMWSGWMRQYRDLFGYPGIQEVWALRRNQFSPEFCEFVEGEMIGRASTPLYAADEGVHA